MSACKVCDQQLCSFEDTTHVRIVFHQLLIKNCECESGSLTNVCCIGIRDCTIIGDLAA